MGDANDKRARGCLDIKLKGEGVSPGELNADQWLDVVSDLQKAIKNIAIAMGVEELGSPYFALERIEDNCIGIAASVSEAAFASAAVVSQICRGDGEPLRRFNISPEVYDSVANLTREVMAREWEVEISGSSDGPLRSIPSFTMCQPEQLPPRPAEFTTKSSWSFIGRCTRVNLDSHSASFRLVNKDRTKISASGLREDQCEELGDLLNQTAKFHGLATWRKPMWDLKNFELRDFNRVESDSKPLFDKLAESIDEEHAHMDPLEVERRIRGGDE